MSEKKNNKPDQNDETRSGSGQLGEVIMLRGLYIRTKMIEQNDVKRQIAIHVANNYINDFDAVLLDAGSTAEMIAQEMFARRRFLSVLTNNMGAYAAFTRAREIAQETADKDENPPNRGNELIISGGRYVDVYESLLGEVAIASISEFTPNIIILGTSGLRCEEGIFCHGSEESAVKKLLWTKPTDTRLIATDWTKIGKRDAHAFGPVEQLAVNAKRAVVVTCEPPKSAYDKYPDRVQEFHNQINKLKKHNIEVIQIPEVIN
ncbi:MAG: DeoR/GlpR transcriptional regulator [Saprospirales bacterium]|nr:DeoR/GlpR transcriptional regulator [Saprospirales bacterium]